MAALTDLDEIKNIKLCLRVDLSSMYQSVFNNRT